MNDFKVHKKKIHADKEDLIQIPAYTKKIITFHELYQKQNAIKNKQKTFLRKIISRLKYKYTV